MARSLKKGPFVDHHLMKKVDKQNQKERVTPKEELITTEQIQRMMDT